jgi:hypothetical protein
LDQRQAEFGFAKPAAPDLSYQCRSSILNSERIWYLTSDALVRKGVPDRRLHFTDMRRISLFGVPGMRYRGSQFTPAGGACRVKPKHGPAMSLSSTHFLGFGRFEDRSQAYRPFVDALVQRAAAANPDIAIRLGWPAWLWTVWLVILVGTAALVAGASAGFLYAAITIGGALWSGDTSRLTFESIADGVIMLIAALSFGLTIPGIIRVLKNERPRTMSGRAFASH